MEKNNYDIIDEPNLKPWSRFIVNPIIILFAAIIVPMFWSPPYLGRFWLPFVWLLINSWLLGSPTIKKEIFFIVIGLILMSGIFYGMYFVISNGIQFKFSFLNYMGVLLNAVMFLFIYLVVFLQNQPYEIYEYFREDD
jgi:hypothetical protein